MRGAIPSLCPIDVRFPLQDARYKRRKDPVPTGTGLPIPDHPFTGPIMFDAKDPSSKFPPIEPLRPPEGAPNVRLILLDDAGFAAMSRFGGPCSTPTAKRLAADGLCGIQKSMEMPQSRLN
jgi:hypothetical protein